MTNPSILFMDWHYVPHPPDRLQAVTAVSQASWRYEHRSIRGVISLDIPSRVLTMARAPWRLDLDQGNAGFFGAHLAVLRNACFKLQDPAEFAV